VRAGRRVLGLVLGLTLTAQGLFSADSELPTLFRLPAGGRPLAPPLLDASRSAALVWFLSEDRNLYVLSEEGKLLARRALGSALPFLALDGFGRALSLAAEGKELVLSAWNRAGNRVWARSLGQPGPVEAGLPRIGLGPDGRLLVASGRALLCLSPAGTALWRSSLPAFPLIDPVLTGGGDFLFALADGNLFAIDPYGRPGTSEKAPGRVTSLEGLSPRPAAGLADGRILLGGAGGPLVLPAFGKGRAIVDLAAGESCLYALDEEGRLARLGPEGALGWTVDTGIPSGRLLVARDRIFVLGRGRASSVFVTGEVLREVSITNALATGLLAPSGLLFSAGADWVLGAYRFEAPFVVYRAPAPPPCPADEAAVGTLRLFDPALAEGDRQMRLLADIEKDLDSVTVGGAEAGDRALLAAIAKGELSPAPAGVQRRFGFAVLPAAEACRLLGRFGAPDSIGVLAGIAGFRGDPALRAAAFRALGAIGVDPGALAEGAFARAAAEPRLDDQVALALLGAVEALVNAAGLEPSSETAGALMRLAAPPYGNRVRAQARAAIARMAGGG